jgi:hypothetical protein
MPPLQSKEKSRTYSAKKLREFSHSKRYPKRTEIIIRTDLGNKEETETFTFPAGTIAEEKKRSKEPGGDWEIVFNRGNLKLKHAKLSGKYCFFFKDKFIGEYSDVELYSMFRTGLESIGAFKEVIHDAGRGYRYSKFMLMELKNFKNNHSNSLYKSHEKIKQKSKSIYDIIFG